MSISLTKQTNISEELTISNPFDQLIKNIRRGIKDWIKLSDKELINDYLEYFELFYANFIVPIIEILGSPVSEKRFRHSYDFQINWFESFLNREHFDQPLWFFFMYLNGKL